MTEETHYQRNREVILNRAKYYYENKKERLREHLINDDLEENSSENESDSEFDD